jgi:flagellar P-ring protein precursor FlgI
MMFINSKNFIKTLRDNWANILRILLLNVVVFVASIMVSQAAYADRIKDLATIQGVRDNQLIGYGIVVGLDGTGDQTTQTPFTVQSMLSMMKQMGVNLPEGTKLQLKNVAAVMLTSSLPPFAQPGQTLDVTVSSIGNAKSLRGGTLVMTPLKGADGQTYAIAQGNLVVGGVGASANGSSAQVNHLSVGRISNGATVERALPSNINIANTVTLELKETDFSTANMMTNAINGYFGPNTALARNGRVIDVNPPAGKSRIGFLAELETINLTPAKANAKIILNARTGSVVMNQAVRLDSCAISHGNLSVVISSTPIISQPQPFSTGETVVAEISQIEINKDPGKIVPIPAGASLSDVVKALNAIGTTPQDLLAILQAMKAAGSLRADLEVI